MNGKVGMIHDGLAKPSVEQQGPVTPRKVSRRPSYYTARLGCEQCEKKGKTGWDRVATRWWQAGVWSVETGGYQMEERDGSKRGPMPGCMT